MSKSRIAYKLENNRNFSFPQDFATTEWNQRIPPISRNRFQCPHRLQSTNKFY